MKKHIVCIGDSNTHGYCADPADCADGGIRFNEEERWTCLLQKALGEEYQAECLQYIKGQRKRLYPLAMKHPALLSVMVSEKLIPREDMENLLQQAAKLKRAELNAMLLEYQSRTFGAIDPELELEKELRRERKRQQKLSEEGGLPDAGE